MITPKTALLRWFPEIRELRGPQRETIERIARRQSTLLLMPTGEGKSLTYQLPPLMVGGISLVISPLIALMREQAERLRNKGIQAISLGGMDAREAQETLRSFSFADKNGFIFTSPERAETDGYLEYLVRKNASTIILVAVDEAHCISQWGHDFRPDYKALPGFIDRCFGRSGWPSILCLTATIDELSQREVLHDFRMLPRDIVRSTVMLRTNLDLNVQHYTDNKEKLIAFDEHMELRRGQKVIVYTHLKHNKAAGTRAIAQRLQQTGHRAAAFDADLPLEERDRVVADFTTGDVEVVCATGAFGMGIDIRDIRGVVHLLLPESLEQYYQEVGRAGRDGAPAFGLLLYAPRNAKVREDMIEASRTSAKKVKSVWSDLFGPGTAGVRSISPAMDFQGRDREYAMFHSLQRAGIVELLGRGPARIDSFEARGADGQVFLTRMQSATKSGTFVAAFRKLSVEPSAGYQRLFELYTTGDIRLTRSPNNVLMFRSSDLSDQEADSIANEMNRHVGKRLSGFVDFKSVIEDGGIVSALKSRFGSSVVV